MPCPSFRPVALASLVLAAACGGDSLAPPQPVVTSVEVGPASVRVPVPGSATLSALVKDQHGNVMTGQAVTWSSSSPGIATVDGAGVVTVTAVGDATITAAVAGRTGTALVTGLAPVAAIRVTPDSLVMIPGDTVTLRVALADAAGGPLTDRALTWTSSAPATATVSDAGLVTAVASGAVEITASVEGRSTSVRAFVGRAAEQLPAPSCTDCLEIVPSAVMLRTVGAGQLLQAFRVDAGGRRTLVRPVWQSSSPGEATVSADGLVTALVPVGSARVTATDGGLTAAPALVVMTSPVQGALLVTDADVVGDPVAVDDGVPFGPGFQYRVRLRTAPAVGQIVMATEQAPIAGRVVSVVPGLGGTSEVVLESVPLGSLVTGLSINETLPLATAALSGQSGVGAIRAGPGAVARLASDTTTFPIGPFRCMADIGLASSVLDLSGSVTLTPALGLTFVAQGTSVERFTVDGTLTVNGKVEARLATAVRAEVDCKWVIGRLPLPITGWLAAIVSGEVPVGVGFKGTLDVGIGSTGADFELEGTAAMSFGFQCAGSTCPLGGSTTVNFTPAVKPVIPPLLGSARVDVTQSAFAFAELGLAPRLLPSAFKVKLIEARGGVEQKMSLASMAFQQADSAYASSFAVSPKVEIKGGASLEALGGLLSVSLEAFSFTPTFDPIARTPVGTLVVTPRVAAGTGQSLGEAATFTVSLDPVTFFGSYAVESVEIRWLRPDGAGGQTLGNGRPGCTSLVPSTTGQHLFTCETDFLEEDAGEQTFYAFVRAKVGGVTLPVPLEVAIDGKARVEVERVIVQISPKPVTLAPAAEQQFQASVSGTGSGGVTWSATGGAISSAGRYTAGNTTGSFRVVAVSNAFPDKADTATVTISGTILGLSGNIRDGSVGAVYNGQVLGQGGAGPGTYRYATLSGRPPGLALNPTSGAVSGTPTQAGQYSWTIQVSSGGQTSSRTFPVTIGQAGSTDPLLGPAGQPSRWVMNIFDSNAGGRRDVAFHLARGTLGANRYQMLFGGFLNCFILLETPPAPSAAFSGSCEYGVTGRTPISGSISLQNGGGFMQPASGVSIGGSFTLTRQP